MIELESTEQTLWTLDCRQPTQSLREERRGLRVYRAERGREDDDPSDDRWGPCSYRGSVVIGGINIVQEPERAKRQIGFIPDRPFLYEKLTAWSS